MRLIDADKIQWKSYPNDYGETNDDYKDIYAFCPKTNIVFLPFEKDTRTFFCSYGERKDDGRLRGREFTAM